MVIFASLNEILHIADLHFKDGLHRVVTHEGFLVLLVAELLKFGWDVR